MCLWSWYALSKTLRQKSLRPWKYTMQHPCSNCYYTCFRTITLASAMLVVSDDVSPSSSIFNSMSMHFSIYISYIYDSYECVTRQSGMNKSSATKASNKSNLAVRLRDLNNLSTKYIGEIHNVLDFSLTYYQPRLNNICIEISLSRLCVLIY